jgi:hypothetical protein
MDQVSITYTNIFHCNTHKILTKFGFLVWKHTIWQPYATPVPQLFQKVYNLDFNHDLAKVDLGQIFRNFFSRGKLNSAESSCIIMQGNSAEKKFETSTPELFFSLLFLVRKTYLCSNKFIYYPIPWRDSISRPMTTYAGRADITRPGK